MSTEKQSEFEEAPESDEEKLELVRRGFCVVAGQVIPDGKTVCIGGDLQRCENGGLYWMGKC